MKKFAVIGYPVAYSLSPKIHLLFARQFNLAINYERLEIIPAQLNKGLANFIAAGGKGANITAPYKEILCKQVATLSPRAQQANAINILTVQADGSFCGDNTDGIGFIRDLTLRQQIAIKHQKILMLGAGGAARGILASILAQQPASITLVNRDLNKAQIIAQHFATRHTIKVLTYQQLASVKFDLIINATSAWRDHSFISLLKFLNCEDSFCYDLNYAENSRVFMEFVRTRGAGKTVDGLGMLVEQAAEAFYLWHNRRPHTAPVIEHLHHNTDQISATNDL